MLSEKSLAQAMTLETYICEETHWNAGWGGGLTFAWISSVFQGNCTCIT
jgi:hypothetical protein